MFDSLDKLALGFITGVIFGFLLQKGRAAKFEVIVNQFLFRDWTVVKIMGTAVVIGSIGVYALIEAQFATFHVKPLLWGGILAGAICFGIGMAVFGYCPGTSVAACGEGRRDAMIGVLGMLMGASVYVFTFSYLEPLINGLGDWGKVTLPEVTKTSPWWWIGTLTVGGAMFWLYDWLRSKRSALPSQHDHSAVLHPRP